MDKSFILAADLAQAQDFTALVVLERTAHDTGRTESYGLPEPRGWNDDDRDPLPAPTRPVYEHHYAAVHLERLSKGTPYPQQVARIKELHDRLSEATGTPHLVADATGVGRPVLDMLRAAELSPIAVTITSGDRVTKDGDDFRVPKRDLVSVVQVLLQSKRLKIAKSLPEAQTLVDELLGFRVNISLSGHDSYGNDVASWREAPHDDLVLAVALATWYGEQGGIF